MSEDKRTIGWVNWNREFKKKKLTQTLDLTYKLFKEKKSIPEIAKIREFKLDSVERQIIELITMSLIDARDVIGEDKFNNILEVIDENNKDKLSQIKEILKDQVTWFEIKCTIASLNSVAERI